MPWTEFQFVVHVQRNTSDLECSFLPAPSKNKLNVLFPFEITIQTLLLRYISVYHSWLMRSKMTIQEYKQSNQEKRKALESSQKRSQIQALDGITLNVLIFQFQHFHLFWKQKNRTFKYTPEATLQARKYTSPYSRREFLKKKMWSKCRVLSMMTSLVKEKNKLNEF